MSGRTISSLTNPTVKAVRALHMRKEREDSGLFLAEGLRSAVEAVELGFRARTVMHGREAAGHPLLQRVAAGAAEVIEVSQDVLAKVSRKDNPQAVVAVFEQRWTPLAAIRPQAAQAFVALHQVRDPGNLGTIVRTADAAGAGGVILVGDCTDPWSVESVRATMGSIFAVPISRASEAEFLSWRAGWPGSVVGALLSATTDHRAAAYARPTLVLMGNEAQGLPAELAAACDVAVKIPMRGRADSLNLSVATGVLLYTVMEGV